MSQQQNTQQPMDGAQKFAKSKQQRAKQKDNTNAWLKKQQQKKKKKLQEQQQKPVELDEKALQKAKRKEQKRLERQQMLKEQGLTNQKQQVKAEVKSTQVTKKQENKVQEKKTKEKVKQEKQVSNKEIKTQGKKNVKKGGESSSKIEQELTQDQIKGSSKGDVLVPPVPKPVYTELLTLENHLQKSLPSAASTINKPQKTELIYKYLEQYINDSDTILVLSKTDSWHPLAQKCGRRVFLYPMHQHYQKCLQCENIVCTYEDIAYLMEGTLTKIFVQIDVVFANGTALTHKGNENIIVLANEYKIPVIGFTGTWNFNAWNFLSIQTFLNKYGESYVQKYDILENDQFQIVVLQIGSVIPKQISGHLQNLSKIYRGFDLKSIKW